MGPLNYPSSAVPVVLGIKVMKFFGIIQLYKHKSPQFAIIPLKNDNMSAEIPS